MAQTYDVRFPMACPKCSAVCAMPNVAITQADSVTTVGIRCRHCDHQWKVEAPASTDVAHMRSGVRLARGKPRKVTKEEV